VPAIHPRTPGLAIGLRKVYRNLIQSVGSSRMLTVGSASMLELALDICLGLVLGLVLVGLALCRFHLRSPTGIRTDKCHSQVSSKLRRSCAFSSPLWCGNLSCDPYRQILGDLKGLGLPLYIGQKRSMCPLGPLYKKNEISTHRVGFMRAKMLATRGTDHWKMMPVRSELYFVIKNDPG
jgi:hypothetical protein